MSDDLPPDLFAPPARANRKHARHLLHAIGNEIVVVIVTAVDEIHVPAKIGPPRPAAKAGPQKLALKVGLPKVAAWSRDSERGSERGPDRGGPNGAADAMIAAMTPVDVHPPRSAPHRRDLATDSSKIGHPKSHPEPAAEVFESEVFESETSSLGSPRFPPRKTGWVSIGPPTTAKVDRVAADVVVVVAAPRTRKQKATSASPQLVRPKSLYAIVCRGAVR